MGVPVSLSPALIQQFTKPFNCQFGDLRPSCPSPHDHFLPNYDVEGFVDVRSNNTCYYNGTINVTCNGDYIAQLAGWAVAACNEGFKGASKYVYDTVDGNWDDWLDSHGKGSG